MRRAIDWGPETNRWPGWILIPGLVLSTAFAGTAGEPPPVPGGILRVRPESPMAAYVIYRVAREHRFKGADYRALVVEGR